MVNGVVRIPFAGSVEASAPGSNSARAHGAGLEEFIAGPENRLASAVLQDWLDQPRPQDSPLVLHGPAGTGKSHAARGLAQAWRATRPGAKVVFLTGAEYARQYAAAVTGEWLDAWREEHRSSALFVLDGIGQLAGKRAAQQELCRTLDFLCDQEAFAVITDRTLPWHLTSLAPALQSRLSAGLAVPLAAPGVAVRRMVLERLAIERGLSMTRRTVDALVAGLTVPLAHLHEGLASLQEQSAGNSIELRDVRQFLSGQHRTKAPTLKNIALLTAKYYGLKLSDLKSPLRRQQLVAARGIVIYLARRLTDESLMAIGAFLGGRDHTTILHGYQRTEKLIKRDPMTRHAVSELGRVLLPD